MSGPAMVETRNHELEKAEVQHLLASGIFERSPGLAQLFSFVCNKYFEGKAAEVKEYNLAVEALGRSASFDQKKDAIVRVQFHRLRDRLKEYYQSEGAARPLRIEIPQGQYIPQFVQTGLAVAPSEALPPEPARPTPVRSLNRMYIWVVVALVVVLAAAIGMIVRGGSRQPGSTLASAGGVPGSDSVRILVGLDQGTFTDGFGNVWLSDRFFEGGSVVKLPNQPIAGTREPRLYRSRRQGNFRYDIPLAKGVYELRLHFAETHFGEDNTAGYGGEGSRAFAVQINGTTVINRLDVVGEAGASTAHIKVFRDVSPAADGKLHLTFVPIVTVPFLNAIEITPGTPGKLRPVRIVAQPRAVTDAGGNSWMPDRFAAGGQMVKRTPEVTGTSEPELYAGERFGNLIYTIDVPPGAYGVTLYMAERWLGPGMPGGGGAGSRLFDILCNGVALVRNVDIFERAGGSNRALVQTFHGIQPDHQGRIVLTLLPAKNFALINALEVTDESR
jgi:Malectin domain